LLALLLSAPNETNWTNADESSVWKSLFPADSRRVRRMMVELPWFQVSKIVRFRDVEDIKRRWEKDLVIPFEKKLRIASDVLDGKDIDPEVARLLDNHAHGNSDLLLKPLSHWEITKAIAALAQCHATREFVSPPRNVGAACFSEGTRQDRQTVRRRRALETFHAVLLRKRRADLGPAAVSGNKIDEQKEESPSQRNLREYRGQRRRHKRGPIRKQPKELEKAKERRWRR